MQPLGLSGLIETPVSDVEGSLPLVTAYWLAVLEAMSFRFAVPLVKLAELAARLAKLAWVAE